MRPTRIAVAAGVLAQLAVLALAALPASAAVREVTIGNYYFEDDASRARDPLVAEQGDQLRFTVRQGDYPPHSVQVDELGISSPDLLLFDTYTTPPLDRPGTYRLYCRAHEDRGHATRLVVRARAATTTSSATTTTGAGPGPTATTGGPSTTSTTTGTAATTPGSGPGQTAGDTTTTTGPPASSPSDVTVPSGMGTASDRRLAPPQPGSLAEVLGRQPASGGPWTRALRQSGVAAVLLVDAAIAAVLIGRRREVRPRALRR